MPTAGCPSDQPDDDSGVAVVHAWEATQRGFPDAEPSGMLLYPLRRRCLRPTPIAVILRRILDVLLWGRTTLPRRCPPYDRGRHDQITYPSPLCQPLPDDCAYSNHLIHAVAAETIHDRDYEVNGARERTSSRTSPGADQRYRKLSPSSWTSTTGLGHYCAA